MLGTTGALRVTPSTNAAMTTVMTTQPTTQARLDALTGLRFFMAAWVFLHHAAQPFFGTGLTVPVLSTVSETGYLAVGFFFVLSGFILTIARSDATSARSYAVRRLARIYPLYLIVIIIGIVWKSTLHVSTPVVGAALGVLLLQSWWNDPLVYFVGVFAAWSLSVEALLYVVFRPLAKRLRTLDDRGLVVVGASTIAVSMGTALFLRAIHHDSVFWLYIFPPTRVAEFALGIVAGLLYAKGHRLHFPTVVLWVVAAGLIIAVPHLPRWLTRAALFAPLWPLLIVSLASSRGRIGAWLGSPRIKRLGEASFALYLVHGLVLLFTFSVLRRLGITAADVTHATSLVIVGLALTASIVASIVLFHWVERPLQRLLRNRLERKPARALETTS